MLYQAEKLVKEANELKDLCMKAMMNEDMMEFMNGETFELYKKTYDLMDTSMILVLEQAKLFEEMDDKLDKLLQKLEA